MKQFSQLIIVEKTWRISLESKKTQEHEYQDAKDSNETANHDSSVEGSFHHRITSLIVPLADDHRIWWFACFQLVFEHSWQDFYCLNQLYFRRL